MALSNTNTELPYIIGVVILIKTTSTDLSQTTQRIMSNIHINGSATVYLSVFDVQVSQLHQKLDMLVECGAKGGEKMIFKLKTNEICKLIDVDLTNLGEGGGKCSKMIHSPPLNETTTAAQATVGESSVTEPHVAVAE
ncbi:unnamed protein product [Brassica oleracea]|uniref:(rape) hypothetical protein n=1 Tax=Brassica napus TaxID=3708 RepID=A0A816KYA9_BRANA|nr:unnamed protein product [Brassica napus]